MQNKNLSIIVLIIVIIWIIGNNNQNNPKIIKVVEAKLVEIDQFETDHFLEEPKMVKAPIVATENLKVVTYTNDGSKNDELGWTGTARITAYSEIDSCHYPDGKGGCLNAYNETIQIGQIACPLKYKKGTMIEIEGLGEFKCMDKTANWVQEDLGMTFDIWIGYGKESHQEALKFGNKQLKYKVL